MQYAFIIPLTRFHEVIPHLETIGTSLDILCMCMCMRERLSSHVWWPCCRVSTLLLALVDCGLFCPHTLLTHLLITHAATTSSSSRRSSSTFSSSSRSSSSMATTTAIGSSGMGEGHLSALFGAVGLLLKQGVHLCLRQGCCMLSAAW